MVLPILSPSNPQTGSAAIAPRPDALIIGQANAAAAPLMGRKAVQPTDGTQATHNDPWPQLPPDPAPLKGLGIPPLNTRQVGDFDRLDAPEPPVARYDMAPAQGMAEQLDLRA
ncbi:MAG: hypothetical protein WAO88_01925 [Roseicyclus sp.]|uniref:hypothetical protein n=1 Tax=Roseicyclus sp. TaxID=1914329 RepID=UPI003BAE24E8